MTKTDFAELKEKLCRKIFVDIYVQREHDTAIISELIEIIQSQSEAWDSINNDFGFFHHANKRYIESGKDKQDVTKIGTPIRIATGKLETCVSETTTRLQKLRDGKNDHRK